DAFDVGGSGDGGLKLPDGRVAVAGARDRVGVERIVLGLDRPAGTLGRPARVALRDEPPRTGPDRRVHQDVYALGPQQVGGGEVLVEPLVVQGNLPEGGQLVDYHVRLRLDHRADDCAPVQRVEHYRLGARIADEVSL